MQWEYRVLSLGHMNRPKIEAELNALCREGWDLFHFDAGFVTVLKRPLGIQPAKRGPVPFKLTVGA